jgi:tetratricopeptide (TPR) repeat protein
MYYHKNLKKFIATVVIVAFIFQSNIFLLSQEKDEILTQLEKSKEAYINGQYDSSKVRLERAIGIIKRKKLERKNILGQCYLLLGAIYEKKGETNLAEENYRRAKDEYGVESVPGANLDHLPLYKKIVKGEIDIETQFKKAVDEYNNGQYDSSKNTLERIIGVIKAEELEVEKKDIFGKCYLLLGAIYEKEGNKRLAEENYRKAKEDYGIQSVEGVVLMALDIYEKKVKAEKPPTVKIIEKQATSASKKKSKKKFPVFLVVAGVAVVAGLVLLLTKKKKEPTPPPNPEFVTSTDSLTVPEGGTAAFEVRLSAQPSSDVSVSVTRLSGDTDINVQAGSSLTFTTTKWNQNQTVTLAASEDPDITSDTATIRLSASGISNKDITATEQDNDVLRFETNTDSVTVREGQTGSFGVRLSHQPSSDIQTTVSWLSGDTDISIQSGGNPTFSASNWNAYQTVLLIAAEDSDTTDGQAIFRISADNMEDKYVTAIEDDNDSDCNVSITSPSNNETVSGTVKIRAKVSGDCNINEIKFYINNNLLDTDSTSPYTADWDTSAEFDGPYYIRIDAIGPGGKIDSHQITVYVSNH